MNPLNGLANRRASSVSSGESSTCDSADSDLASYLALLTEKSPDLAPVVRAWPDLPEAVKAGIPAMVRANTA